MFSLKKFFVALWLSGFSAEAGKVLTLDRLYQDPPLEGARPKNLQFSPDGRRITFLRGKTDDSKKLDIWEYDLQEKTSRILVDSSLIVPSKEVLSDVEKARRERMRISDSGIVEYHWSKDGQALVFPLGGNLYYKKISDKSLPVALTKTGKHETDVKLSPKGNFVSFVRNDNLFVIDVKTRKEHQLTFDAKGTRRNGVAEFIAQEEMGRQTGYWWAGDEKSMAFTQIDESPVKILKRYEVNGDGFEIFEQRYPAAGENNVRVKLGVLDLRKISGRSPVSWLNLGPSQDIYVPRVQWQKDRLAVQIQSRDQKTLELWSYDVRTGKRFKLLTESDPKWVDISDGFLTLKKSSEFIWSSERSGFQHLYLYNLKGQLIRPLTEGNYDVTFQGVDEENSWLYFSASKNPIERHLYRISLKGGEVFQVTSEPGWHRFVMAEDGKSFIDMHSQSLRPSQVSLRNSEGQLLTWVEENKLDEKHPLFEFVSELNPPEFGSFKNAKGTEIFYRLLKPKNFQAARKYPLIVNVYGGPGVQMVGNFWMGKSSLWAQILAQKGYLVLSIDNRGADGRGKEFKQALFGRLGQVEVADQKAGVQHLITKGFVDPERVGITGHSYGGYLTLMALLQAPDTFKVGVAIAPVSDWALYDTHYTERFLGTPSKNSEGYKQSGVLSYIEALKAPLLLVHGMADDNVFFTHSTMIYKALQDKGKRFEMMNYPGAKHGISGQVLQKHLHQTSLDFFDRHLTP